MLIEESINMDLSHETNNLNIIKLGNSLTKYEIQVFVSMLKEKKDICMLICWYARIGSKLGGAQSRY